MHMHNVIMDPESFFPCFFSVVSLIKKQFQFRRELLHNLSLLTGQDIGYGGVTHENHNTTMLRRCVSDVNNAEIVTRPRRNYSSWSEGEEFSGKPRKEAMHENNNRDFLVTS